VAGFSGVSSRGEIGSCINVHKLGSQRDPNPADKVIMLTIGFTRGLRAEH
jgi:hypothetical protein